MKTRFKFALVIALSVCSTAFAAPTAEDKADAAAINSACAADAATAGCAGEVVGKGLLKCMHNYKEANKSFKVSEGCREAIQKLKSDKQVGK